ncbi:GTPase [Calothrix sp. UHCC 0171]|uniref:GTPase n=1 Tax=Calothrix sp. UHCC 0171 TaxID=3110245 RepID=UPI002B2031E2|nr:GTPase [Calothrix sp. UHCC 0171]MEA5569538.1 GTPase [Calothrix sp. UHCC 0171]
MNLKTINIAVAGHTNTGKTTLIRTLMKQTVGKIGDYANVTQIGELYYFDGLQATFIDTPGFQQAGTINMFFELSRTNPELKMPNDLKSKLSYDLSAVEALNKSDVVIYVASLSNVPDGSHKEEISIVKRICPKVVGVLNQYNRQSKASNKQDLENRICQWINIFKEQSIEQTIVFDAHWDNPSKVNQLYESILLILDNEHKNIFSEGLERFKKRQLEIRREVCKILASFIINFKEQADITVPKSNFNKEEEIKKIAKKIDDWLTELVFEICSIYEINAEYPTIPVDELLVEVKRIRNYKENISITSGAAGIFGAVAGFVGGIVGAVVGVMIPGSLVNAVTAEMQIGATLGAAIGSLAIFSDDNDMITLRISEKEIETLIFTGIAIIWGLSNNGYGRDRDLSISESKDIICRIQNLSHNRINLLNANKVDIIEYSEKILDILEGDIE